MVVIRPWKRGLEMCPFYDPFLGPFLVEKRAIFRPKKASFFHPLVWFGLVHPFAPPLEPLPEAFIG